MADDEENPDFIMSFSRSAGFFYANFDSLQL